MHPAYEAVRFLTAVVSLALCLLPASKASAAPDPYQIFERARRVLQAQSYPDPIFYRTTVRVSEGAKDESEHFRAEALSGGDVRVKGVSQEEQAAPHQSTGVNFKLALSIGWNTGAGGQTATVTQDAHRLEASPDYLGVPLISPTYAFGLTTVPRYEPETTNSLSTSKLKTIATVTAVSRVYRVTLLGTEVVDGLYTDHLQLEPTSHPERYRIRDLWVDAYTYQIVQLQTQGNFTAAPMSNVPWLVTFQNVGGSVYIKEETALAPLAFRDDRTFSTASISFDEIRATDDSPPILPTMDKAADTNLREPESTP
jgi:hypothetical protein